MSLHPPRSHRASHSHPRLQQVPAPLLRAAGGRAAPGARSRAGPGADAARGQWLPGQRGRRPPGSARLRSARRGRASPLPSALLDFFLFYEDRITNPFHRGTNGVGDYVLGSALASVQPDLPLSQFFLFVCF